MSDEWPTLIFDRQRWVNPSTGAEGIVDGTPTGRTVEVIVNGRRRRMDVDNLRKRYRLVSHHVSEGTADA